MIQPSAEIGAVFARFLRAFQEGDEASVRALVSPGEETLILGTDPREWFRGAESVELILVQMRGIPRFEYETRRVQAFEEGVIGWVAADVTAHLADGPATDLRISAVFERDGVTWRLVHMHTSSPRPDDPERIGAELSFTMKRILDSLDADVEERALRRELRTRTVTFVFTDIEGSTQHTAEAGDYDWATAVADHFSQIRAIAERYNGMLIKTMGDGAMLAFGSAEEAVSSAVELMEAARDGGSRSLRVRVGIHTGEAVRSQDDFFGQTVNKTARIASAALPGQILVSAAVKGLVPDGPAFTMGPGLEFELKGLPGTHELYPVLPGRRPAQSASSAP